MPRNGLGLYDEPLHKNMSGGCLSTDNQKQSYTMEKRKSILRPRAIALPAAHRHALGCERRCHWSALNEPLRYTRAHGNTDGYRSVSHSLAA